jgi:hypothetical protein
MRREEVKRPVSMSSRSGPMMVTEFGGVTGQAVLAHLGRGAHRELAAEALGTILAA